MSLSGKTALITGSARRIGRACALKLAREGADILIHYNTSKEEAEELARSIRMHGGNAWTIQQDLAEKDSGVRLMEDALKKTKGVDILVNSASIFPRKNWKDTEIEDFYENFQINALTPFTLSREFAKQKEKGECIVNFLDSRIIDNNSSHLAYHISKRALFSLTRILSSELAPKIRVNAIAPGLILPPPGETEEYLKKRIDSNPLKRIGSLEHLTESLSFLIHNTFITGQVLFVDGGRHLKGSFYGL
jgi:pteridine reductase